ncbi:MAG: adenosylcobinamide-GDP ribazoletransferase [Synergistaceae bacterium]|jgi:adenosylcobinamide-GDP ribazoletransferase|nr:adenosylcobinamide-GDP ribazoletransferase [Synergistaceae bacterium]
MSIIAAVAIAFGFLTVLPMPRISWTAARLRYFPVVSPLVGAVVGLMGTGLFAGLLRWEASPTLRGVLMTLFYLCVTGGLHMDGLMDTCDAVFSRRDREARLKILSDTHVGAFAVMGCFAVMSLKAGIFSELFGGGGANAPAKILVLLALIPIFSRTGLGMLFYLPFAREDGLARTLGDARVLGDRWALILIYVFSSVCPIPFLGIQWVAVPLVVGNLLCGYGIYCVKTFGGITGDLMGAFVELSETAALLTLLALKG